MRPNVSLQLTILFIISIPVQCQFEFNDLEAIHGMIVDTIQVAKVDCISILRPTDQNEQQKSTIDELTRGLIKEYNSEKYNNPRPSVMSYTTEQYEKACMDPNKWKRNNCIYGGTIAVFSDSTNAQLAQLSVNSYSFEHTFWLIFFNRTELTSLIENVRIRVSTRFWVAQSIGNDLFRMSRIGVLAKNIVSLGYVLWAKDRGVVGVSKDFYPQMTGLTVIVGTLQFAPYTDLNHNASGEITSVTGFYGEIWNDLQETLMFNSVFVTPKDGTYGTIDSYGNWTGLYGMIVGKQVDVLLGAMTVSETRDDIVDFLHAIQKSKYKIFYKKEEDMNDWLKIFRPLAYTVWIALIIWIIVGGTVAYFVSLVVHNFQRVNNEKSLINCMYFVLRALCNQGLDEVPTSWALRIFLITAYLNGTLIITSYSASLISVLAVKTSVEPFEALPDILATDYKLTITSNSTDYDFFAKTTDPVHREIYETSIIKNQLSGAIKAMKTACENRKTGFFGTLTDVTAVYRYTKLPCVLLALRSEISPAYKTIAVAKHSQYREILNRRLFRMIEHGLVNRNRMLYMPNAYETSFENENGIGLIDVGTVFLYLVIFNALSVAIFILELSSWKYQLKQK